jgi:hypothetical protein
MKKKVLIGIGLVLFLFALLVFAVRPSHNRTSIPVSPTPLLTPTPTFIVLSPIPQTSINPNKKIKVGDIIVVDFYQSPKEITAEGNVLIDRTEGYEMVYYPTTQSFQLSITQSPFAAARIAAEEDFIKKLGVTKSDVCKLSVEVTTPFWANQQESGTLYPLSFCK